MSRQIVVLSVVAVFLTVNSAVLAINRLVPSEYSTIQAAIDDCNNGDMVIVEPNTYTGDGNRDIDFGGRAITVQSTNPEDPCVVAATIIDCNGAWLDGHRGFYFHNGEGANSVLAGLTIKNGFAPLDLNIFLEDGGAILIVNSSPTIRNCIISDNSAEFSGAMGVHGGRGGGICLYNNANALITNCTLISNNSNYAGAGIACCSSSPTINSCIFSNGSSNFGGGISCEDNSNPLIINCTITDNYITGFGAGIFCSESNPTILKCTITGNAAGDGAYGYGLGGGIASIDGSPTIRNCVIVGNYASVSGGGIYSGANDNPSNPSIINCTIAQNHAGYYDYEHEGGGGIACYFTDANLVNSVLWDNTAVSSGPQVALFLNPSWPSTLKVSYCDIQGGQASVYVANGSTLDWYAGNIDIDPCFVEPGYWIFDYNISDYLNNRSWVDGDYHLYPLSLCINAGDPNYISEPNETDLDGSPRIIAGRIDMGAYESNHIDARLWILPRTINRHSRQRRIMAWLRLPKGVTKDQIDSNTPLLLYPGEIEPTRQYIFQRGHRGPKRVSIIAYFDKSDLMDAVSNNGRAELKIVGQLKTGQYFYGTDTVRIINRR